ncbi:hypothetical protein TSMEX_001613 [Taenia solium]|eukprot:TsM_000882700 transcript=TsM_000882700 gene=TsM_000882700
MGESKYCSPNISQRHNARAAKRPNVEDTLPPCPSTSVKKRRTSKSKVKTAPSQRKLHSVSAMNKLFQRFKKRTRNYLLGYASRKCGHPMKIRKRPLLVSGKARVRRQRGCIKRAIPKKRISCPPRKNAKRQPRRCRSSSSPPASLSDCCTPKLTSCGSEPPKCSSASSTLPRRKASRQRVCDQHNSGDWKTRLRPRPLKSNRYPNYRCLLQGRGCDRNCSNTSVRLREYLRSRFQHDTSNSEEVDRALETSPTSEDVLVSQVVVEPTVLVNSVSGDAPDIDSIKEEQ